MDATMLCHAGYRVVMPNIHGSTFGADWIRPVEGHWAARTRRMRLPRSTCSSSEDWPDPTRLCVMGLSYGGYLTQWLIGATNRFAAAAAENGVSNQVSVWANSYFGLHYNRRHGLGEPLTDAGMRRLWRSSPLRHARRGSLRRS